jgi:hypothetical protein
MAEWTNNHNTYYLLHMFIAFYFLFIGFKMTTMKIKLVQPKKKEKTEISQ